MAPLYISASDYHKHGIAAWHRVAAMLLDKAGPRRVWCFHGDLGSGKTTCIQALCATLGVQEAVQSPTFGLVHEYIDRAGAPIYHFDLYRLQAMAEAREVGVEAYLDSGAYCFIEWPARAKPLLPEAYVDLFFTTPAQGGREVKMVLH